MRRSMTTCCRSTSSRDRPICLPSSLALLIPDLTRSTTSDLSSSAIAEMIVTKRRPIASPVATPFLLNIAKLSLAQQQGSGVFEVGPPLLVKGIWGLWNLSAVALTYEKGGMVQTHHVSIQLVRPEGFLSLLVLDPKQGFGGYHAEYQMNFG